MNKIGIVIAAALGGAAVYWWIKRTCPCAHDAAGSTATASRDVGAGIASTLGATLASDFYSGKEDDEYASAAAADLGTSSGGLSADVIAAGGAGGGAYASSPSSAPSMSASGCTSCGDSAPTAYAEPGILTAPPSSPYDGGGIVSTSQPLYQKALSFASTATLGSFV